MMKYIPSFTKMIHQTGMLQKFLYHTQAVERWVKSLTEALIKVYEPQLRTEIKIHSSKI